MLTKHSEELEVYHLSTRVESKGSLNNNMFISFIFGPVKYIRP